MDFPPIPINTSWHWYYQPSSDRLFKVSIVGEVQGSAGLVFVKTMLSEVLVVQRTLLAGTRMDALSRCLSQSTSSLASFEGLGPDSGEIMMRINVQMKELRDEVGANEEDEQ